MLFFFFSLKFLHRDRISSNFHRFLKLQFVRYGKNRAVTGPLRHWTAIYAINSIAEMFTCRQTACDEHCSLAEMRPRTTKMINCTTGTVYRQSNNMLEQSKIHKRKKSSKYLNTLNKRNVRSVQWHVTKTKMKKGVW